MYLLLLRQQHGNTSRCRRRCKTVVNGKLYPPGSILPAITILKRHCPTITLNEPYQGRHMDSTMDGINKIGLVSIAEYPTIRPFTELPIHQSSYICLKKMS
ncbi:hypothetical protein CDAR_289251 [Caerostris darwini]|uniref:Uncharacterized protein n=1 Tax=Caerostris darwini TaxID=1538125 RepID=A0AAV4PI86_9ARAC|nr:hypothetical protein CDAR_289251 [Caerostris darwini]